MRLGDVVDELLNQHGLADASTSEETDLAATGVGREQVDDLDTGLEHLGLGGLVDERRGLNVNGSKLVALDGTTLVHGLTNDVHDTAEGTGTDGDLNGKTSVDDLLTTNETLGTFAKLVFVIAARLICIYIPSIAMHLTTFSPKCCYCPSAPIRTGVRAWHPYRNLENQLLSAIVGGQGVENGRELLGVELDCDILSASAFGMLSPIA